MASEHKQIDQDQIVSLLLSRDTKAFEYLFDNYAGAIYGIIVRIIIDETIAQEVLHDAFLRFWEKIDQYDDSKGRLFTWMANISRNLSIDRLRSREVKKAGKTDSLHSIVTESKDESTGLAVDGIGVKELLEKLREEERLVIDMVYFKGYTQAEVAETHNIPLGTVKTRTRMGLQNLRKLLSIT